MKQFARLAAAFLLVLSITGCAKKSEETAAGDATPAEGSTATPAPSGTEQPAAAAAPGQEVLPGASSVRAAMQKKDYETAVGGLLALKGAAAPGPQAQEYGVLYDEVKFALMDASQSDPKAAAALMSLRAGTAGR
jgi:hypothetical protein